MSKRKPKDGKTNTPLPNLLKPLEEIGLSSLKVANAIDLQRSKHWQELARAIEQRAKRKMVLNLEDYDPLELFPLNNKKYKDYINIITRLKQGPASLHELSKSIVTNEYVSRQKFKEISSYRKTIKMRIYALRKSLKETTGFRIVLKDGKYSIANIYAPRSKYLSNSDNGLE